MRTPRRCCQEKWQPWTSVCDAETNERFELMTIIDPKNAKRRTAYQVSRNRFPGYRLFGSWNLFVLSNCNVVGIPAMRHRNGLRSQTAMAFYSRLPSEQAVEILPASNISIEPAKLTLSCIRRKSIANQVRSQMEWYGTVDVFNRLRNSPATKSVDLETTDWCACVRIRSLVTPCYGRTCQALRL